MAHVLEVMSVTAGTSMDHESWHIAQGLAQRLLCWLLVNFWHMLCSLQTWSMDWKVSTGASHMYRAANAMPSWHMNTEVEKCAASNLQIPSLRCASNADSNVHVASFCHSELTTSFCLRPKAQLSARLTRKASTMCLTGLQITQGPAPHCC